MYYNARWYDPALGRFAQADTLVPEPGNPIAWDRYAYVMNNPLRFVDPSGHFCIDIGNQTICSKDADSSGIWLPPYKPSNSDPLLPYSGRTYSGTFIGPRMSYMQPIDINSDYPNGPNPTTGTFSDSPAWIDAFLRIANPFIIWLYEKYSPDPGYNVTSFIDYTYSSDGFYVTDLGITNHTGGDLVINQIIIKWWEFNDDPGPFDPSISNNLYKYSVGKIIGKGSSITINFAELIRNKPNYTTVQMNITMFYSTKSHDYWAQIKFTIPGLDTGNALSPGCSF
jgi:hypothetical protein